ncbi:MAG: heme peroxidase [Candidatus Binatia bacterium]|nr:MAG: heme peroxidase [Candidatus Binatia bacterium]
MFWVLLRFLRIAAPRRVRYQTKPENARMTEQLEGLRPSAGWPVVHWFYRLDRPRWRSQTAETREALVEEFQNFLERLNAEPELQVVPQAGVTKFDFGLMAIHPDLWRLQQLGQQIASTGLGACLVPVYQFLSLTEASEYITNELDWARLLIEEQKLDPTSPEFATRFAALRKRTAIYAESRIHPKLPDDYPVVCFYPMSKARRDQDNWYRLSFEERKKLMLQHGEAGRRFADRVTQLITTCTGLDDWEWGVTLFARDLKAIRDIVYELRYDEASAVYGLFGSFYVGIRFAPKHLARVLHLS